MIRWVNIRRRSWGERETERQRDRGRDGFEGVKTKEEVKRKEDEIRDQRSETETEMGLRVEEAEETEETEEEEEAQRSNQKFCVCPFLYLHFYPSHTHT